MKILYIQIGLYVTILSSAVSSCAQSTHSIHQPIKNKEVPMSVIEKNKEVVRTVYEQVLNQRNTKLLPSLVSENYQGVNGQTGIAAFEAPVSSLLKAIPDAKWIIEEILGEGNKVLVKQHMQGTQTGPFQTIAPTHKTVTSQGLAIYELKEGKIIRSDVQTDRLGFFQQLGVIPSDLNALTHTQKNKDQVCFIDKFFVPSAARNEFLNRVKINRDFIRQLPGFIEDTLYEHIDESGNLVCITIARWENQQALENARQAVQTEYKKQGFNPAEMFQRLGITMDRGIYTEALSR